MALSAQAMLNRVASELNDLSHERWTQADILTYLSDGQRAAVRLRPEVNPVTAAHQLVAGTKQSLPATAYRLISVTRNLGSDGQTPGRVIRPNERADMDQSSPNWHNYPSSSIIRTYFHDANNRRTFFVWPPAIVGTWIEIVYADIPPELSSGDDIGIDDVYAPALLAYALHRATAKDIPVVGQDVARSQYYFDIFRVLIAGEAEEEDIELQKRQEQKEANRA